jgi:co-chaperonin GroES (HSP10)
MTLKPIGSDVLVGPLPKPAVSEGGIAIPQNYQDDRKTYRILAIGESPTVDSEIVVGRRCLLDPGILGVRHLEDGTGRLIVKADRILAVW